MAIVPERTINDMTSPDLNQQPLCIEYPDLEVNFELKSGLIHLLPTFRGLAGEDPHKHLKEFHVVCSGESLFEYWGRFNELVKSCPHHQIPDHLLIQYFYEGLSSMDRKLIDAASGGALFNKTPTEARNLISIMASNTQQFGTRYDDPPRRSNDRKNSTCKSMWYMHSPAHVTDMCPTLQEGPTEHADAIGGFSGQQQRRYDPFSNTYNPGWKDHPNLSYGAQSQNFQRPQYRPPMPPPSNPKQEHPTAIPAVPTKCSAIPTKHSNEYSEFGVSNESAGIIRYGKELQETQTKIALSAGTLSRENRKRVEIPQEQDDETKEDNPKVLVTRPPFPERFAKSKKDEEAKEILETFRKVEVNIPLLDAIKQIPRYARFLKELCTSKGKLKGNERVSMGENVSAILQRKLPPKCKDPARRPISCLPRRSSRRRSSTGKRVSLPADFYVLDMREDNSPSSTSILLGRPFLKTARTKIDVHAGALTMEFDGEIIFNIFDSMRYPSDIPTALFVDAFDPFVQKFPAIDDKDYIKLALEESPMPMEEENMGVDPLVQVKKPQFPSSKKHRPMYHYHNPPDNAAGKPATAATVRRSPPSSATVIAKRRNEERNDTNMADVAGTTPHQQTTLDDIARRIARMEANLIDLFEHVGLTPRRPPTP
ncbi:UNVERIFIED_CONTAM: hypothetical protein Sangu_2857900 [Sesamum angustifolium]|uniref:Retrotransposon gag domain-containing protein n=1 Tax=Sesamum angustifolium TaxID=2727405 RepID=A0AAW2IQ62_9LAMI